MISIRTTADMQRTLDTAMLDPPLRALLALRRDQLTGGTDLDLADMVHLIVVQPCDTLAAVEVEAGVPIGRNLIDGKRLGERGFVPSFDWVENHGHWLESVTTLDDSGFSLVLLVPRRIDIDIELILLLEREIG